MGTGSKLSITIIGHNEADHLRVLLPSLSWADEVVYVDCESTDHSVEFAENSGCRVFTRPNNPNLNVNKAFAMDKSEGDWIFYLDPDERIPENLSKEIRTVIQGSDSFNAYQLNRRNHFFGKWLKHGSQYPDIQLRLFKRGFAEFPQKHVHERLTVEGNIGQLENDLLHYPYQNISQYLQKFDFYTGFEANFLYESGKNPGAWLFFRYLFREPLLRFIRRYVFKGGFLDGWQGLFAAMFDSLNFVVRYFKLLEQSKTSEKADFERS